MKTFLTDQIRNVALIGHGHAGKTSLAEAMLFQAGAVNRLGSIEAGSTVTDHGSDEHSRQVSIRIGLAHLVHEDTRVNLLDTPGFASFFNDARAGMSVAETTLVVIDAVAGVEVQTERTWAFAGEQGAARVVVLDKMDRENADFDAAVTGVVATFGRQVVPVQVPVGQAAGFRGVVDLVGGQACLSPADGSARVEVGPPPAEVAEAVAARRLALAEMVAESDEELMVKFLEAGDLNQAELRLGLRRAVAAGALVPLVAASGLKVVGIRPLLDLLVHACPSPSVRKVRSAEGGAERKLSDDEPVSLQVFKTLLDPFAGRLSLFKVYSGVVRSDMTLHDVARGQDERCANLMLLQGKEQLKVGELHAGDIGCLAKLKDTQTGDTLADKAHPIEYPRLPVPEPVMSYALTAKNQGDEDKISSALAKVCLEDLALRFRFDPQTKELVISGAGDRHVEAVVDRLHERFKVDVVLHPPRVPYQETITASASDSYRHKKQTGGAGQFAEVHAEIKPQPRGEGFVYDTSRIFGGSVSQNFFPSIEKGVRQVLERGPLAGYPVVDVRVEVFDGKMHPVDSKDIAFQIAGRQLVKQLILRARPILLEPIMRLSVGVPEDCMGDVMGDLSGRRGRVQGMETEGRRQVIKALVPLAELLTYQAQLKSLTGGRGEFHFEYDHHDTVPAQVQEKIVAESRKAVVEDDEG